MPTARAADNPTATFKLSSASGSAGMSVGGNATWAFGLDMLDPPSADPPNTQHTLEFYDFDDVAWEPRQELIAFDIDYADAILNPDPSVDFVPFSAPFKSLRPGQTKTYSFPLASTSHVIRYWHGSCAGQVLWPEFFGQVSDGVFTALKKAAEEEWYVSDVTRDYDAFAPMFNGYLDSIEYGFSFEGRYNIEVAGSLDETFKMNPAYTFDIDPASGLVTVANIHKGVEAIGDVADVVEPALEKDLPAQLAHAFEVQMSASLENPVYDTVCDPQKSLEEQQAHCFETLARPDDPNTVMYGIFKTALLDYGLSSSYAESVAAQMKDALEPRNFSCHGPDFDDDTPFGECHFHPVIQRINVLPDRLEFVFAPEVAELYTPEHNLMLLYYYLPALQQYADPSSDPDQYCYLAYWRPDGDTTYVVHGVAE